MFTQPFHVFRNHNASLSEGGALPVVVQGFSETPHGTRGATDFPHPMRQSVARLPLACAPSPGASARRTTGGDGGGSDPHFLDAGAPPGRGSWCARKFTPSPSPLGVAPSTVIPAGRLSSRPGSRQRKTADHKWPSGRERQAWGMHTTRYLRSAARAACHST